MKTHTIFVLTALVITTSASQAAQIEFRGGFCIKTVTAACQSEGWVSNDCGLTMRYNPRNLGTNGPKTRFSVFGQYFAENYTLASGSLVGSIPRSVAGTFIARGGGSFTALMNINSQSPSPAVLTATSAFITVAGAIQDFDGIPNCDITFSGGGPNTQ